MGFITPAVRIIDNMQLPGEQYVIRVKEMEAGSGTLKMNSLLIMDPSGAQVAGTFVEGVTDRGVGNGAFKIPSTSPGG